MHAHSILCVEVMWIACHYSCNNAGLVDDARGDFVGEHAKGLAHWVATHIGRAIVFAAIALIRVMLPQFDHETGEHHDGATLIIPSRIAKYTSIHFIGCDFGRWDMKIKPDTRAIIIREQVASKNIVLF